MNRARQGLLAGLVRGLFAALVVSGAFAVEASSQEPTVTWRLDLGRIRNAALVSVFDVDGKLLVEDEQHGLTALEPETGEVLWFVQMTMPLAYPPRATSGTISLTSVVGVMVVDAGDGERLAEVGNPFFITGAAVAGNDVLYVPQENDGRLVAWLWRDGREAWHFDVPGGVVGAPMLSGTSDATRVVFVGGDGVMRSLKGGPKTPRAETWTARVGALAVTPLQLDDLIVTAGRDGRITSRRAATGGVVWQRVLGEPAVGALVPAGDLVLAPLAQATLALDASTGETRWTTRAPTRPLGELGGAVLMRGEGDRPRLWSLDDATPSLAFPYGTLVIGGHLVRFEGSTFAGLRRP